MIHAVQKKGKAIVDRFDTSVFNGEYITGDISEHYLGQLELIRSDSAKQKREAASGILELHNNQ